MINMKPKSANSAQLARKTVSAVNATGLRGLLAVGLIAVAGSSLGANSSGAAKIPSGSLSVPDGRYGLDKTHGYISFSYSHLGFSNPEVGFNRFDVDLLLNAADPASSTFSVRIDAASIDSRVAEFDKHLVGADYFDVANHPEIRFDSQSIQMTSETTADITGTLSLRGQSHPLKLTAVLNKAGMHPLARVPALGVSARATLSRSQWGLKKYVPMVSDEVELRIEIELPKVKTPAAE